MVFGNNTYPSLLSGIFILFCLSYQSILIVKYFTSSLIFLSSSINPSVTQKLVEELIAVFIYSSPLSSNILKILSEKDQSRVVLTCLYLIYDSPSVLIILFIIK